MTPMQRARPVDMHISIDRLCGDFTALPPETVERCVSDTLLCVNHLGVDVTPGLIEHIARLHLEGMIKSEPPSGRRS